VKPIRSFLYAPGNRERIMAKAPEAGADAVMFDLADSVPIAEKDTARKMVADALTALAGRNLFVKLNDADSGYIEDDLDAVARAGLSGVLLPEVDKPETVIAVDRLLSQYEAARAESRRDRDDPASRNRFRHHSRLRAGDRLAAGRIALLRHGRGRRPHPQPRLRLVADRA
jgi:hypothetical protein